MAKSMKETGLVIGGALLGLLMSGTASAATSASTAEGKYFQLNDVNSAFHFAHEEGGDTAPTDDKDKDKDKKGKEGSCSEDGCGEGACGGKKDKK